MIPAFSVAVATVAVVLVYSFGRTIRSPLRRWQRRRREAANNNNGHRRAEQDWGG